MDAPVVTPSTLGEAMGLRIMPCMMAPARERLAPTMQARIFLGKRTCRIMTVYIPLS